MKIIISITQKCFEDDVRAFGKGLYKARHAGDIFFKCVKQSKILLIGYLQIYPLKYSFFPDPKREGLSPSHGICSEFLICAKINTAILAKKKKSRNSPEKNTMHKKETQSQYLKCLFKKLKMLGPIANMLSDYLMV